MASLHRKAKKISIGRRIFGDKTFDDFHPYGTQMVAQDDAIKASERAAAEAANQPVIPLPDEEELARIRRRKNRGGGRAATVLTSDEERLGG
jgi:hypothetical protein